MSYVRFGVLIFTLFLCAIGVYAYYEWQQQRNVDLFMAAIESSKTPKTVAEFAARFQNAPDLVCKGETFGFNDSTKVALYIRAGHVRRDFKSVSNPIMTHEIYDQSGASIWRDNQEVVYKVSPATPYVLDENTLHVISSKNCAVWSNPDERLFEVPSLLKPVPYTGQ